MLFILLDFYVVWFFGLGDVYVAHVVSFLCCVICFVFGDVYVAHLVCFLSFVWVFFVGLCCSSC
jgi:hypothetical protein